MSSPELSIVDAQLHEPAVSFEWEHVDDATRREVLTELQLGFMRAVGVDRAVLFPVDLAWGEEAAARFPERFSVVPMITLGGAFGGIDAEAPDLDDLIAAKRAIPGVVAVRIVRTMPASDASHAFAPIEVFDRGIAACARAGLPIFMSTAGDLVAPARVAERYPELTVIVDHLGLSQPPSYQRETPPFRSLPELLALAAFPNIAVKFSGAPTLSEQSYPFADLWPHLRRIVDAFGPERLMWGSDISRVLGRAGFRFRIPAGEGPYQGKHTYAEALLFIRETDQLSPAEKNAILGGTARTILDW